jgi:hypothetical protein
MYVWLLVSVFLIVGWGQTVLAQTLEGEFKHWRVFTLTRDKQKLCYITGSPATKTGTPKRPDMPYVVVAHRGANASEVSVSAGYAYKNESTAAITVDAKPAREFFTSTKTPKIAWARDATEDKGVVEDMLQGKKMTVAGTGQGKTSSQDTYDLQGFAQAYTRMQELCTEGKQSPQAVRAKQGTQAAGQKDTKAAGKASANKDTKASTKKAVKAADDKDAKTTKQKNVQATRPAADAKTAGKKDAKTSPKQDTKARGKADTPSSGKADAKAGTKKDTNASRKVSPKPSGKPEAQPNDKARAQEERAR